MTTKTCSYKNCKNVNTKNPELTFFRFPIRYESKCTAWTYLSGVPPETDLKNKYLCEDHFDSIHLSKTPRRTALLPNAIPFPYNSDDTPPTIIFENYDESEGEAEGDAVENESVKAKKQRLEEDCQLIDVYDPLEAQALGNKPVSDVQKPNKSSTYSINGTNRQSKPIEYLQPTEKFDEIEEHRIKDDPSMSTFIYLGEEYIQMPKRIFLEERKKMLSTIESYKGIVAKVKQAVNITDL